MSLTDQCPSTKKNGTPAASPNTPRDVSAATGRTFWRSLDDIAGTREFRDFLEREFPAHASELLDGSRRHFLKIMGASLALAGAATVPGCRRPDHRILAFNESPESIIPGKPLFYASVMPLPGGGCEGILCETHEGRPTKIEGNPLHPRNRGKSSVWAQSSVLDLYDPDRAPEAVRRNSNGAITVTDWKNFATEARGRFDLFDQTGGSGLAFLVEKSTSPSRDALKQRMMERWGDARWFAYESTDDESALEGARQALGAAYRTEVDLSKTDVLLALDRDILAEPREIPAQHGFAQNRFRPGAGSHPASDATMSRLYAVESSMTLTGGQADHRLALRPARITAFAIAIADAIMAQGGGNAALAQAASSARRIAGADDIPAGWIENCAKDLVDARGRAAVLAGTTLPPATHALVHAINEALGALGQTITYRALSDDAGASSLRSITELARSIELGEVSTLVVIGCNPVYDAPADLNFASLYEQVETTVHLGQPDETAALSSVHLMRSHPLETWGDVVDFDGTYSVVQPMIKPLWDSHSELELLATLMGESSTDGYEIVRNTYAERTNLPRTIPGSIVANPDFEKRWRRCLHDGHDTQSIGAIAAEAPRVRSDVVGRMITMATQAATMTDGIDVVFAPCAKVHDGRFANNGWLQELPGGVTKVTWDNPALISRRTAERLGIKTGRKLGGPQYNKVAWATVTVRDATLDIPVWVQPGMADDVIHLPLGYGRRHGGRIARDTGFDAFAIRPLGGWSYATGGSVEPARGRSPYLIATTQDHWSLEGRAILREVDLEHWKKHGDKVIERKDAYGNKEKMHPANALGMEGHTPLNRDVYLQRPGRRGSSIFYHKVDDQGQAILDDKGRKQHPLNKWDKPVQQWGMSIDMTTCTGCNACVIACQAENNIPIVGKKEVAKGREMHWIRVDRYYASDRMDDSAFDAPDMGLQPMPCVHCENAPCEVVCPVNATVHSTEGTNDMAYNRCIGTRYCANNCPYKVRRFNLFDYATKKFMGDFKGIVGIGDQDGGVPNEGIPGVVNNENFIPPRLREKVSDVESMQRNPNVTIRSRGVMEKCTYCLQRINAARVETKLEDLDMIPDGFFQVACQQACPTGAITFGDIYDYVSNDGAGSVVSQAKADLRTYAVLGYLNIVPRTTHMLRVRNPNHDIRPAGPDPFEHGHGHDDEYGPERKEEGHVMSLPILQSAGALA